MLHLPLILLSSLNFFLLPLMFGVSIAGSLLIALGVLLAYGIVIYACRNRSLAGMAGYTGLVVASSFAVQGTTL